MIYHIDNKIIKGILSRKHDHGRRMVLENFPVQRSPLGPGLVNDTGPGIKAKSAGGAQTALGGINHISALLWLTDIPALPPSNFQFGFSPEIEMLRATFLTSYLLVLFAYGCSFTHPLAPPLKQVCHLRSISIMFERGKELERGLLPLSSRLPSPAINACNLFSVTLAGEESGVKRQLPTKGKQNHNYSNSANSITRHYYLGIIGISTEARFFHKS